MRPCQIFPFYLRTVSPDPYHQLWRGGYMLRRPHESSTLGDICRDAPRSPQLWGIYVETPPGVLHCGVFM
jgi:hypothetical protein